MATPLGWSQGGSGSVCLAFDQLRDVIESQEELIHQLRNVEEKAAHAKTKALLAKEEEKLQFALGEVEVLSKQLEKEKMAFEKALSSVKSRVLQESSKKDQLITKCNEIESHIIKQEDILNGKENEIKELQQVISQQKQNFRNHISDFRIQKQQETYMAQMGQRLAKAEAKSHTPDASGLQELSESTYTDVLDQTCSQNWQSYGVHEVNQMKRLTGPGLSKGPEPRISVMISGGPWPNRLSKTCFHYLGEFGEDQIYEAYRQGQANLEALLCGGTHGPCSQEILAQREEL